MIYFSLAICIIVLENVVIIINMNKEIFFNRPLKNLLLKNLNYVFGYHVI